MLRTLLTLVLIPSVLTGCGDDIAGPVAGTFVGDIVAGTVVQTGYTVTVTAVDKNTLSISGADFTTFEVDVRLSAGIVTSLTGDTPNQLSYALDALDFDHTGAETVTFSGAREDAPSDR